MGHFFTLAPSLRVSLIIAIVALTFRLASAEHSEGDTHPAWKAYLHNLNFVQVRPHSLGLKDKPHALNHAPPQSLVDWMRIGEYGGYVRPDNGLIKCQGCHIKIYMFCHRDIPSIICPDKKPTPIGALVSVDGGIPVQRPRGER